MNEIYDMTIKEHQILHSLIIEINMGKTKIENEIDTEVGFLVSNIHL